MLDGNAVLLLEKVSYRYAMYPLKRAYLWEFRRIHLCRKEWLILKVYPVGSQACFCFNIQKLYPTGTAYLTGKRDI